MRTALRTLALALTVSTGALWAQTQTATPQSSSDEPATSAAAAQQPTDPATPNPPATANPTNQESDALPQSGTAQSSESTTPPPVAEEPLSTTAAPPPAENPKPAAPAPQQEVVNGTVVSSSASALVIETASGAKLTFVVDSATTEPELHAKDAVSVQYVSLPDGSRHADRVTVATPKKSAVAAAPRRTTPPAPKQPAVSPAPAASVAVAPAPAPAPAPPVVSEPAPAAEPVASAASSTADADSHTLSSDTQAVNPLATTKTARDYSPTRMIVPVVILLGGLLFLTVLGVRQARREA